MLQYPVQSPKSDESSTATLDLLTTPLYTALLGFIPYTPYVPCTTTPIVLTPEL